MVVKLSVSQESLLFKLSVLYFFNVNMINTLSTAEFEPYSFEFMRYSVNDKFIIIVV